MANPVPRFSEDAAARTGISERTIRREVQIGTKLGEDVKQMIRDTAVADRQNDLVRLAQLDGEDQRHEAKRLVEAASAEQGPRKKPRLPRKREPFLVVDHHSFARLRRKGVRELSNEQHSLQVLATAVEHGERAWGSLVEAWTKEKRDDLGFALERSSAILAQFIELRSTLRAFAERCGAAPVPSEGV
jgi:hypothetical protein